MEKCSLSTSPTDFAPPPRLREPVVEQPVRLADRRHERGPFERFAERATTLVSGGLLCRVCAARAGMARELLPLRGPGHLAVGDQHPHHDRDLSPSGALLQNSQRRSATALHEKLDAIADGLADLMEHQIDRNSADLTDDIDELKAAVGLQHKR
jgi:hypothetical protein